MKKSKVGKWPSLLEAGQRKPGNMQVWWDVYEKHEKALDKWEERDVTEEVILEKQPREA